MRTLRRLLAVTVAATLVVAGGLAFTAGAASADDTDTGFTVDDFAGHAMGTRTVVAADPWSCDITHSNAVTFGTGTMHVVLATPDSSGCQIGSAQIRWDSATALNIAANGTDRIVLKYRDVVPSTPSAITFGLSVTDDHGRVAQVGGLTRNGGAAGDFLTIRYQPAYVGDVSYLHQPAGFDLGHVVSLTLSISTPNSSTTTSVTFEGLGFAGAEPAYEQPSIGAAASYAFPGGATTTATFPVTGYPEPDVTVTGLPAGLAATTSKGSHVTNVTISGNPTAFGTLTAHVHAVVASSLTDDRDITIVAPSLVTWAPASSVTPPVVGQAASVVLGAVTSTPVASAQLTGVPAGMTAAVTGGALVLSGTPTAAGPFTITGVLTNGNTPVAVSVSGEVDGPPIVTLSAPTLTGVVGQPLAPLVVTIASWPEIGQSSIDAGSSGVITTRLDENRLQISGTPTAASTQGIVVRASNTIGTTTVTIPVSIGTVPTLAPPATVTTVAGTPVVIPLTASGTPGPQLTATGLPAWLSLSGDVLIGFPTRADVGDHTVGVHAANGFGTADASIVVTVDSTPLLTGPSTVSGTVGAALSATVTVDGYPAPAATWSGDVPDGLTVGVRGGAVVVSGTPTRTGTWTLHLAATNVAGTAGQDLVIDVLAAPHWSNADPVVEVPAGQSFTTALAADGYRAPVLSLAPGTTLPAWLDFTSGQLTGTPTDADAGDHGPYDVVATNSAGEATAHVTIRVTTPAAFADTVDASALSGAAFTAAVAHVTGFPLPAVTSSDLPAGLTLATAADGTVTITGSTTGEGPVTVHLHLDNGAGTADDSFSLELDTPPTLAPPADAVTLPQGAPATVELGAGGYPAPALTIVGALPDGLALDGDRLVGTPTTTGTSTVTVHADNGAAPAVDATLTIDVVATPVFVDDDVTATIPAGTTGTVSVSATGYPAPTLSTGALPAWLTFDPATGTFTAEPTDDDAGVAAPITVTAHNSRGDATATVTVTVTRSASISAPPAVSVVAGRPLSVPVTTAGFPAPTVTATGLPAGVDLVVDGSGATLSGAPSTVGTSVVTLTASNAAGPDASTQVTIDATAEAVAIDLAAQSVVVGDLLVVTVSGLAPDEGISVTLHSTPVLLGTTTADASGIAVLAAPVPAGTPAGAHTVVVATATGASATAALQVSLAAPASGGSSTGSAGGAPAGSSGGPTGGPSDASTAGSTGGSSNGSGAGSANGSSNGPGAGSSTGSSTGSTAESSSGALATTGSDVGALAGLAGLAVAAGAAIMLAARRRRA